MNKSRWLTVIIIVLLVLIVGLFILIGTSPKFKETEVYNKIVGLFSTGNTQIVSKVLEPDLRGAVDYGISNDNIIIAQKDGVYGINDDGEWLWDRKISLESPLVISKGNYVAVADVGGQALILFNKNSFQWQYDFPEGIVNIDLTSDGIVTVVHGEKGYRTAVSVMNVKGDTDGKGIVKFSRKISNNFVVSAISSPSKEQVFINGLSTEGGELKANFSFLKMADGQVYSTKTIDDSLFPFAYYLKDNIILVNSSKIISINVKESANVDNDNYEVIWEMNESNTQILSANVINDKYIIFAVGTGNNSVFSTNGGSHVYVIDEIGQIKVEFNVSGTINKIFEGNDENFAVCTENNVYYYDINGNVSHEYNTISNVKKVYLDKDKSIIFTNKDIHILTKEVLKDE